MNKETEILCRLVANHLHLAQFEPLRGILLALRTRNHDLARLILQSIVARSGRFPNIAWSSSCSSPALLTYLSTLELLQLEDASSVWKFDTEALRLRAEFLLLVQHLIDLVSDGGDELELCRKVLDRVLEIGVTRLRVDEDGEVESSGSLVEESELMSLRELVLGSADVFEALSGNIEKQIRGRECEDNGLAVSVKGSGEDDSEEDVIVKVLFGIQKMAQVVHLNAIRESLESGDVEGAISHLRFLHFDYGLDQSEYRIVLKDLLKAILSRSKDFGESWLIMRNQILKIYSEALSSNCRDIVQMMQESTAKFHTTKPSISTREFDNHLTKPSIGSILLLRHALLNVSSDLLNQALTHDFERVCMGSQELLLKHEFSIHDEVLSEEIEIDRVQTDDFTPRPLVRLQNYLAELKPGQNLDDKTLSLNEVIRLCKTEMYHYARVSGLHVLECIMDTALSAVKREQLEEASNVLQLFPQLQPLVAAMGWDLLAGKIAARRKLMQLLWTSKSQIIRLEESSLYGNKSDEMSCVEHLCDTLCYQLDLASFVACVNSGQSWNSKFSLARPGKEQAVFSDEDVYSDHFVENFVLERLSVQTPIRVLFDVVPGIKFREAIELITMQPIASTLEAWKRKQDVELMHMRYALESVVLALGAMERSISDEIETHQNVPLVHLKDLRSHLDAISNIPRKIFMVNVMISLLHMDNISANSMRCESQGSGSKLSNASSSGSNCSTRSEEGNKMVISFTSLLLDILRQNIPSSVVELENTLDGGVSTASRQALEWQMSISARFIEEWEWRLSILQHLLPLSERQWRWKEALTVLRAAPSKLLNLCMQKAKFDIGEEAVHRFSLSAEDKATLELAEWVDSACKKASVDDVVSRVQDLDFSSLRSQLGPLSTILLCIDVAATSAKSAGMSQQLLNQAQIMLSEIYPGGSPKVGSTYWDQILEVGVISVSRRLLKRLQEFLEQDNPPTLQEILSGEIVITSSKESHRQEQRERALALLHQMIEDAHMGKRQFLSGKLHNLARAVSDEETEPSTTRGEGLYSERVVISNTDKDTILGLGLRVVKPIPLSTVGGETGPQSSGFDIKNSGKGIFSPLSAKPMTYLSQFILHVAAIGDIVDGTDTTHDFNFFSVVYEWPKDLLTRLVFERGSTDAAGKAAEIMCADFVHEVISACVPPVYPPRSGHGWACIPVVPSFPKSSSENKVLSPSSKDAKPNCYSRSSATPGISLYPLELDVVKHLAKISPVRAVLACVFGSCILYDSSSSSISSSLSDGLQQAPDVDRLFYEFALDQSERFPTLNRWIQMQTNLHRVSEFAVTANQTEDDGNLEARSSVKRIREHDTETELDADDINSSTVPGALTDLNSQGVEAADFWHDSSKSEASQLDSTVFLSFDWDNEEPYQKAVERLISEGKLMDAVALSDRFLRNGASDQLLQLIIERAEEMHSAQRQGYGGRSIWSNSWQYCLRLKNKQLAARLALRYVHTWELDAALDVLTMCSCHLHQNDSTREEVLQMKQDLQRYSHILSADDHYTSWQEVEADCKDDPEGLALRLAGKGAVSAALKVAESAGLSIDLRRELQGRQLVKLLTADPLNGGGPAEASRFLSSLRDTDDALPVAMGAMQLLPNLRSKQLLVHFFLKRREGNLSDAEISRLNSWALGLRVLSVLPVPWQQRCSSLHEHPHLILEVLLMRKQLQSAALILKEFPSLRDNLVVTTYATKAIAVSISSPPRDHRISVSGSRPKQRARPGAPPKLSFTSSLSNLQKEARKAFSWAPKNAVEKNAPKDVYRKRKNSGLSPSDRVAWETMTGIQEDQISSFSADGQERPPPVSIAEEWMLTGDPLKDESIRSSHRYESAPDITLFKALLALCSDESVSAKIALDLCINQMKNVLSSQQMPENASMETIGRAYHATETFVQGLLYAKSLLRKLTGGSEFSYNWERNRDADDTSSDAGSSSVGSQSTDELSEILSQADVWLGRAELLQSLLGSGIAASLDDIADGESSARLRDRLVVEERYSMAVYTSKKCKIDVFPVWNAWGHALIRMERYGHARVKFKQALQLYKGDPGPVVLEIINTIEGGPPVDVSAVRSMYEHLAKSAPTILDDSLSADSYLNILYMPSTFPRSERSRRSQVFANNSSTYNRDFEDGPRSNLDSVRYTECVNYLQDYGRQHLLRFMFRQGHYLDACYLFFPPDAVPPPPQPSIMIGVSSSSPQRLDSLATDYGTIDDLSELCISYGAMPILEDVISTRMSSTTSQEAAVNQYTVTALARICLYCETHKHFNYLYGFQVIKKDHVAAGLCCIQLFMNSSSQEEAVRHLEHAKMHFDEGLSARHKGGESTKLVTKGLRGKNAAITEEGLVKFSTRVSIQVEVAKSFNDSEGAQWEHSLFGNPNDPDTFRRRCKIAEVLVEKNFDLAFQVIYEFNLPAVDIYAGVAASLAERKRGSQLTEFFRNIKGTIDDDDWDQVLGAAINVYANKHKERPDRLIDMLTSSHRKVLACVVCGRLKSAFQIASRSGSVADVQYVAHQALHANALPVLDMCKQWLAQYM